MQRQQQPHFDAARLSATQIMLCARIDELTEELGVSLIKRGRVRVGPCPIHGGDKHDALNLYPEGDTAPGFWRCYTKHCEAHFQKTIIGFVRGVLSRQKYDWRSPGDKMVSFLEAIHWIEKFLGQNVSTLKVDEIELEKRNFANNIAGLTKGPVQKTTGIPRATVRSQLRIPAEYFVRRGWSKEILERYDVGLYPHQDRCLSNRAVVPVYENTGKFAIGFTGRSIFERCPICSRWHAAGPCPVSIEEIERSSKWWNQGVFAESYLFNYWYAQKHIEKSGVAVLVEGPGDLFRLAEAGIEVGLGMFGDQLSDQQQIILETSGAMSVIILTNNDEAGKIAAETIGKKLCRSFRTIRPSFSAKDLGEMLANDVRNLVKPLVDKYWRKI